ncbi:MAG: glycosyltransferase [Candidatus Binatia bacterium]
MPEESKGGRFVEAAATAFLRRRLHHQRMRIAALRALRAVSAGRDDCLAIDFDEGADVLERAAPWMAGFAADVAALPPGASRPLVPRMAIVILAVGSRGDVQPFLPIAQRLARRHRVRIATHEEFRPLVEGAGLEFFPLAGDPRELVGYMIRTGGRVVPTRLDQIVEDVPRKRATLAAILESTWRACTEPDPGRPGAPPFAADGIIANPPSYGHIHCAEALHVPLHMIFTMPWTPTSAFPHPMTRLVQGAAHPVRNFLSYGVVDALVWAGVRDVVNAFRERTLGLAPLDAGEGVALLNDNEVPFTYLFPASVIPKPADWGPHVDLANFVFWDQGATYEPPPALREFLAAGEPPIYVGFGSCVVEDPAALTRIVFEALAQAGGRAVVSRGWARLGGAAVPPNVYVVDDCPHDWLLPQCRAVCHHGGAGTTAAGLRAGLPTAVVPFFGDQFFWGQVVAEAGAGPAPIPAAELTSEKLAAALVACARPEMRARAEGLGAKVRELDGVDLVVEALYRHLPVPAMQCVRDAEHLATVYCEACRARLCQGCWEAEHAGHGAHPYRYVEWSVRPPHGIADELTDLIADAATALRAGLHEIRPLLAPRQDGVVLGEVEATGDEVAGDPVWTTGRGTR